MKKLFSLLTVSVLSLSALFVSACNSLPEGAQAPKLNIESLALTTQDDKPVFVIGYTLKHASPEALPIIGINADVFLRNEKVATLQKQFKNQTIAPNQLERYELIVPANLLGSAGLDSLANNTLIMLQGSCAVTVNITDDSDLNSFNPVSSYSGLVKVVSEQSVKINQPESIPQPSADPVAEVQQSQSQQADAPSQADAASQAAAPAQAPAQTEALATATEPAQATATETAQASATAPAPASQPQQPAVAAEQATAPADAAAAATASQAQAEAATETKAESAVNVQVKTSVDSKTTTEVVEPQAQEAAKASEAPAKSAEPMPQASPAQDLELLE